MTELKTLDFKILSVLLLFVNVYIFKTLILFNNFLSKPIAINTENSTINGTQQAGPDGQLDFPEWFHPLATDIFLIGLFYIQHSLLKVPLQKVLQHWGIEYLERSIYNLFSALILQTIICFWVPITSWALWNVDIEPNSWPDWTLWSIRSSTWLALLSECVVLDISDLLGWKQVVYHFNHLPPPSLYRSADLNQTFANMRHPGLLEFSILLWVTPTLSGDRLVCSGLLSAYVVLGFSGQCHAYVARERARKLHEANESVECSPSKRVRFRLPKGEWIKHDK
ncbi:hypothetical protein M8J76_012841 [Diaphorina citri]|nr:hypothetical protein M8J76_012841 [Diaphorina citri]